MLAIQNSTPMMDEVDISVPINKIPEVLTRIEKLETEVKMRIPSFGHAGDGNLHIYLYKKAKEVDGNMSGEHGIGYARQAYF